MNARYEMDGMNTRPDTFWGNTMKKHCLRFLDAIALSCLAAGCSTLEVDVSVYNGPMTETVSARLAHGKSLAKAIRDLAADMARVGDPKCGADFSESSTAGEAEVISLKPDILQKSAEPYRQLLCDLVDRYEKLASVKPSQEPKTDWCDLAHRLEYYGNYAQSIAISIGEPILGRNFTFEVFIPFLISRENDFLVGRLIAIDELGRKLTTIGDSVLGDPMCTRGEGTQTGDTQIASAAGQEQFNSPQYLSRVGHIMSSQGSGTLMTSVKSIPIVWYGPFLKDYIEGVYDERYWKPVNTIEVQTVGKASQILVKDEIGNWQIKSVTADPTEIAKKAAEMAVEAAKLAIR